MRILVPNKCKMTASSVTSSSVLVDWVRATLPPRTFSRMDLADAVQISGLRLALVTRR